MFLKHGAKKINEIELVAPTGFARRRTWTWAGSPWSATSRRRIVRAG
jgi:hypothetical protein